MNYGNKPEFFFIPIVILLSSCLQLYACSQNNLPEMPWIYHWLVERLLQGSMKSKLKAAFLPVFLTAFLFLSANQVSVKLLSKNTLNLLKTLCLLSILSSHPGKPCPLSLQLQAYPSSLLLKNHLWGLP